MNASLDEARPAERDFRRRYEGFGTEQARVSRLLELYRRRERLAVERSQLDVPIPRRKPGEKAAAGLDGPTAHTYA
ncbi:MULTISPECIES: hypothetical protein [unclassified Methylobacterium]|uniref:hypothetical protein n=1 Tax=unclassified Methylobacterium TaxID=2615210 RepID=UPI002269869F|nr:MULTISPECIES: hypothetical protein [unclassified Methylobacterium]